MPDSNTPEKANTEANTEARREAEFEAELEELLRTSSPSTPSVPSDYPVDLLLSDWSDDLSDL